MNFSSCKFCAVFYYDRQWRNKDKQLSMFSSSKIGHQSPGTL